ncbi:MAG: RNA-directed DNA polymerase [Colwellia sp.]|uniref:RNA-directed DNA polymerase n=1 Tax=Alteromonadales TaxID=135622 RepID=UPI001D380010|nr:MULTISPECIES: RNA-directed DNA polymerase [Alteromonadales]NQZ28325.1 RNA-directed DNA polymerase [Colwellia sp.]NRA81615.1 RNA-directed DNA polymerase [Pseudoalteromonas sp.]
MNSNDLISKGFFPKEFPSFFDSSGFGLSLQINNTILEAAPKTSHTIKASIPKGAGFRRNIAIPNPKHFTLLAKFLSEKSNDITQFYDVSEISMSKSRSKFGSIRAVSNSHLYEEFIEERIIKGFASKYLVTADISKFYGSIYTHSIPWALHGKIESKNNRSDDLWGNKLDRLVRNMQDGQTLGLPIGPDTSRIISEIIGVALDKIISESSHKINGIRFIDDFFLFADTHSEAEAVSNTINRALRQFELTANEVKTKIEKMPAIVENIHLQTIQNFKIRKGIHEQKSDIIHLYNLAIEIYKENPNDNAFAYFLAKIEPIKIHKSNWNLVESICLQIASAETKNLIEISKIFVSYKSYGYPLSLDKIKEGLLKIAQHGIDNNFGFEISWAFWLLTELKIVVNNEFNNLSNLKDPMAIISIFMAREKESYTRNLDLRNWNNLLHAEALYDDSWLLAYEGESRGWLKNQNGIKLIDQDDYFKKLKNLNISFLNFGKTIQPLEENTLKEESDHEHEVTGIFRSKYAF